MKISLVVLTHNRARMVDLALTHSLSNAGRKVDELVWVDNGSTDGEREGVRGVMRAFMPAVSILHRENLGVAKGYNRGMAMTTGDYVAIIGCDMLMPEGWLETWERYLRAIPETGVACIYSKPFKACPERLMGPPETVNGLPTQMALPIDRRIFPRATLRQVGYFREDMGLYGWEDVEWGHRAFIRCTNLGRRCYAIPDLVAEHLGTEGISAYDGKDDAAYHAMKAAAVRDPEALRVMENARISGYPYVNPFP
jgi:GT2 family glycosyltransferase